MSDDQNIKVTDKRMFTPDGELREEFRDRVDDSAPASDESPTPGTDPGTAGSGTKIVGPEAGMPAADGGESTSGATEAAETAAQRASRGPAGGPAGGSAGHAPSPTPGAPPAAASAPPSPKPGDEGDEESDYPSGAQFEDLIGLLAQGASVYIQQARRPEQRSEHLELARLHVDLLAILKERTKGNLSADEKALLDDAIYQLRMAVVQLG